MNFIFKWYIFVLILDTVGAHWVFLAWYGKNQFTFIPVRNSIISSSVCPCGETVRVLVNSWLERRNAQSLCMIFWQWMWCGGTLQSKRWLPFIDWLTAGILTISGLCQRLPPAASSLIALCNEAKHASQNLAMFVLESVICFCFQSRCDKRCQKIVEGHYLMVSSESGGGQEG